MASTKEKFTKDGRRYFKISVSRGYGKTPFTKSWYPEPQWAEKTVQRMLKKAASEFEIECQSGQIENRQMRKEKAAKEAAEKAKLKTVRQYADGVFMPTKETTFSENARSSYRMFLDKHILPVIGDYLLSEVSPSMINKLLLDFQKKGYAHATTIKLYNILNGIFEMAFLDYSIETNPMLRVTRPKQSKDEPQKQEAEKALTIEQLRYCLSCLDNEPLKWKAYITLCADSGCRRGELCGLQWQDISWQDESITIQRNLQYTADQGVYIAAPKNGKVRIVDVGKDTLKILKALQQEQANTCISKWVFTQDNSHEPMHPQSPTRYFSKFGKKYNIPDFHPHLLRHTSASVAITNGADVASVSARLGHSDTSVTLRMYTHANEESIRKAGNTVRDLLKKDV